MVLCPGFPGTSAQRAAGGATSSRLARYLHVSGLTNRITMRSDDFDRQHNMIFSLVKWGFILTFATMILGSIATIAAVFIFGSEVLDILRDFAN